MGNELKLSLENFQSISQGELVFHTGTNVIVGQSNSGKTATFRALKACLSNPLGSQRFIKKGTKQASVTLEYNGNQIIWKRTPKESSYVINGEDFIKTGKSNAFKIMEDTGFVIDDNDVIMNIEEELQLPFPFGISKSELFKLYENVFCVSDSAIILKAAKEKEEITKSKISTLEDEIIKNKNKLAEIQNFKKEVNLKFLEDKRDLLKEKAKRINYLKDGLDAIHKAAKVDKFHVKESFFENRYSSLNEKMQLKKELNKLKKLHNLDKCLKEIKYPVTLNLQEYESLHDLKNTMIIISNLQDLSIPVMDFTNKLQKYEEVKDYSKFLTNLKIKIKNKLGELQRLEENVANIEKSLKEFKVCPLCHQPISTKKERE